MLLQQIVGELDAELERLLSIRAIVITLGRTPQLLERFEQEIFPQPVKVAEELGEAAPPTVRRRTMGVKRLGTERRRKESAAEPSAFAKRIPSGPVVVSAQQLHEHKQSRAPKAQVEIAPPTSAAASEQPDRLIRDLSQRWLSSR